MIRKPQSRRTVARAGVGATFAAALSPRITMGQTPEASPETAQATPIGEIQDNGHYPSGEPSVPDAWVKMPERFAATDGPPLNGEEVTALVMTYSPPPTSKGDSAYWQGLDERLGGTWSPTLVPHASYGEKASTQIASGDMPDLFYLNYTQTPTPLQKFVQEGAFRDLTDFLTGDELAQYPNLSTFPDYMWESVMMDGKITGVPTPQVRVGQVPMFRVDWSEQLIGKRKPTNAQEMHDVLVAMSLEDPDGNGSEDTWGIAKYGTGWDIGIFHHMFGVPPLWKVDDDGKFIVQYEMEEFRQAMEYMRDLYAAGAYHPDAVSMGFDEARNLFMTGRAGLFNAGGDIYGRNGALAEIQQYQPDAEVENIVPFSADGGPGITYLGSGIFGLTAISYTVEDDDRVRTLLRLLDWFSSPFGSDEWWYKNYGDEGTHHEINENGFPISTDQLDQENAGLTGYMGGSLPVNFNPDEPELAPLRTDLQKEIFELGVINPAANLYSPTFIDSSGQMFQSMFDGLNEIVVGRMDISELDNLVQQWKDQGGEQAAQEYEEAHKANQEE